jgi:hypothetical protein
MPGEEMAVNKTLTQPIPTQIQEEEEGAEEAGVEGVELEDAERKENKKQHRRSGSHEMMF